MDGDEDEGNGQQGRRQSLRSVKRLRDGVKSPPAPRNPHVAIVSAAAAPPAADEGDSGAGYTAGGASRPPPPPLAGFPGGGGAAAGSRALRSSSSGGAAGWAAPTRLLYAALDAQAQAAAEAGGRMVALRVHWVNRPTELREHAAEVLQVPRDSSVGALKRLICRASGGGLWPTRLRPMQQPATAEAEAEAGHQDSSLASPFASAAGAAAGAEGPGGRGATPSAAEDDELSLEEAGLLSGVEVAMEARFQPMPPSVAAAAAPDPDAAAAAPSSSRPPSTPSSSTAEGHFAGWAVSAAFERQYAIQRASLRSARSAPLPLPLQDTLSLATAVAAGIKEEPGEDDEDEGGGGGGGGGPGPSYRGRRPGQKERFTLKEMTALVAGIEEHGLHWATIHRTRPLLAHKKQGDLKDKWRNWQKNVAAGWTNLRVPVPDTLRARIADLVKTGGKALQPETDGEGGTAEEAAAASKRQQTALLQPGPSPRRSPRTLQTALLLPKPERSLPPSPPRDLALPPLPRLQLASAAAQQHGAPPGQEGDADHALEGAHVEGEEAAAQGEGDLLETAMQVDPPEPQPSPQLHARPPTPPPPQPPSSPQLAQHLAPTERSPTESPLQGPPPRVSPFLPHESQPPPALPPPPLPPPPLPLRQALWVVDLPAAQTPSGANSHASPQLLSSPAVSSPHLAPAAQPLSGGFGPGPHALHHSHDPFTGFSSLTSLAPGGHSTSMSAASGAAVSSGPTISGGAMSAPASSSAAAPASTSARDSPEAFASPMALGRGFGGSGMHPAPPFAMRQSSPLGRSVGPSSTVAAGGGGRGGGGPPGPPPEVLERWWGQAPPPGPRGPFPAGEPVRSLGHHGSWGPELLGLSGPQGPRIGPPGPLQGLQPLGFQMELQDEPSEWGPLEAQALQAGPGTGDSAAGGNNPRGSLQQDSPLPLAQNASDGYTLSLGSVGSLGSLGSVGAGRLGPGPGLRATFHEGGPGLGLGWAVQGRGRGQAPRPSLDGAIRWGLGSGSLASLDEQSAAAQEEGPRRGPLGPRPDFEGRAAGPAQSSWGPGLQGPGPNFDGGPRGGWAGGEPGYGPGPQGPGPGLRTGTSFGRREAIEGLGRDSGQQGLPGSRGGGGLLPLRAAPPPSLPRPPGTPSWGADPAASDDSTPLFDRSGSGGALAPGGSGRRPFTFSAGGLLLAGGAMAGPRFRAPDALGAGGRGSGEGVHMGGVHTASGGGGGSFAQLHSPASPQSSSGTAGPSSAPLPQLHALRLRDPWSPGGPRPPQAPSPTQLQMLHLHQDLSPTQMQIPQLPLAPPYAPQQMSYGAQPPQLFDAFGSITGPEEGPMGGPHQPPGGSASAPLQLMAPPLDAGPPSAGFMPLSRPPVPQAFGRWSAPPSREAGGGPGAGAAGFARSSLAGLRPANAQARPLGGPLVEGQLEGGGGELDEGSLKRLFDGWGGGV